MVDGGLIVGYLTAALLRGGKRVADRAVDSLLDRLTDLVAGRMGSGPLDRLKRQPGEETVQREVGLTIDGATSVDANFASELAGLVAELDQRGGRQMINEVYAQMNVQAFDHGVAIGRDFNYFNAPDPTDMSDAPGWVKFCVSVGMLVAFTGMFIFGYTILTSIPDVDNPDFGVPPGIPIGFGVAFLGIFIVGIARSWLDEPAPVTASTLRAVWAIATLPRPRRPDQPAPCSRTCVRAGTAVE